MNYESEISDYIELEIKILRQLNISAINDAINLLLQTWDNEGTVYVFGNGGSATTASHYQNDFNKGVSERLERKFRFQCLNDNIATVMAVANDCGYEEIFKYQLEGRLKENDIILAISGSGNSKNIIRAVEYARSRHCKVIGLTGYDGGKLKKLSDISIHVPVNSMQVTEDIHMVLDHLMMSVLYRNLCGIEHLKESKE